jgi:hypothetical protein
MSERSQAQSLFEARGSESRNTIHGKGPSVCRAPLRSWL